MKITHIRKDGTIQDSMKGVAIPPDNGYYTIIEKFRKEASHERVSQG